MESYPYWAYAAVPGSIDDERERAALDEGRRLTALTLAVECGPDIDEGTLATAAKFEAYLRGGVSVESNERERLEEG